MGISGDNDYRMPRKLFWGLSLTLYVYLALAGFGYFGSGPWAQLVRQSHFYEVLVKGPVEKLLGTSGSEGEVSGRISAILANGEIRFKPADSFSFFPADPDQVFYGKNVVSTGPGTRIIVVMGQDEYQLTVGENTTVIIDRPPPPSEGQPLELQVEIVGGQVEAKSLVAPDKQGSVAALKILDVQSGTSQAVEASNVAPQVFTAQKNPNPPPVVPESPVLPPPPVRVEPLPLPPPPPVARSGAPLVPPPPLPPPPPPPPPVVKSQAASPTPTALPENVPFSESLEGFNKSVEASVDEILTQEITKPACGNSRALIKETERSYPTSPALKSWSASWGKKLLAKGCK